MALDKTAVRAVEQISEALANYNLSAQEQADILKIIGQSIVQAVEQASATHREATVFCCGPEADLAHKIADEVERKNKALIANLMALR